MAWPARRCLKLEGLLRRRWAGNPVADVLGLGAGGAAGAGSRSRISPIKEKGEGDGLSGGIPSSSSEKSRTKRSPRNAMICVGRKKRRSKGYVSSGELRLKQS